jgi:hypothetical protein
MMQKLLIALGIIIIVSLVPTHTTTIALTQPETPDYAKWGQLAMKETKSRYPNADIIDYKHEGSEPKGESTIEKFKLWLKEGDKEFGVLIRIEYTTETKEVVKIEFEETAR